MKYKTILLFGAPGSGKGTQGKIMGTIPGFHHSSTGDIFRTLDLQSPVGRTFWDFARRGDLVPDEFTISLWKQYIKGKEFTNEFYPDTEFLVLDGMPRNKKQMHLLDDVLEVVAVIYLRAEKAKMIERLRRRALKENRIDDASDVVIEKRMTVFEKETRPVLDMYPPHLVHRIDATLSQIRVLSEIVRVLVPLKEDRDTQREEAAKIEDVADASPVAVAASVSAKP